MANIFDKAKKAEPKKAEKHEIVNLPALEKSLTEMAEIDAQMAELEARRAILDSEVRDAGKEAMIELYNKKRSFPGTLKIIAGKMNFQFITQDRYKKIDEERSAELVKTYGENIVEEETIYSFNTAILMKHMDHISELLMGSKKLSEEDKENLLTSETTYAVKKGTLKDLFTFKAVKKSVEGIVEDIQPIFNVKSIQKEA